MRRSTIRLREAADIFLALVLEKLFVVVFYGFVAPLKNAEALFRLVCLREARGVCRRIATVLCNLLSDHKIVLASSVKRY